MTQTLRVTLDEDGLRVLLAYGNLTVISAHGEISVVLDGVDLARIRDLLADAMLRAAQPEDP